MEREVPEEELAVATEPAMESVPEVVMAPEVAAAPVEDLDIH
jgi:hypothetical protein